jgi:regulator of sigma E protease
VLDGGHIMFATIARLRGKPLPFEFMATLQSIFMVLLLSFVLYVGFFDFRRMARDHRAETEAKTTQSEPAAPTPAPAPVAP